MSQFSEKDINQIEECICWAAQQGCTLAQGAAVQLGKITHRVMYCAQAYYNAFAFRPATREEALALDDGTFNPEEADHA